MRCDLLHMKLGWAMAACLTILAMPSEMRAGQDIEKAGDGKAPRLKYTVADAPAIAAQQPAETTRAVVVNGTALTQAEIQSLDMTNGTLVQPGRYWYDHAAGLYGLEGGPSVGQIHPNLNLGGPLPADASNGNTGVFINGRELHVVEVMNLQKLGPVLPGRYWMNAQGVGGMEGGPPVFNLGAAITAQQKKGGGMYGGWNRTTPGGHLGGDDNCSYFFDPKSGASVMNCK